VLFLKKNYYYFCECQKNISIGSTEISTNAIVVAAKATI